MFPVKDVLPRTLKTLGVTKKYNEQSVIVHWQEIAGDEIASHAWPISLQRGLLLLAVNNSVWSHHLMMLKADLIHKINSYLQERMVIDIKFQAGDLRKYQNCEENEKDGGWLQPCKLTTAELAAVWQATAAIQDDKLRKKCYYVLIKQTGMNEAKKKAGWKTCKHCSVLVPPGQTICSACSIACKQERKSALAKLLAEAPWLSYQETAQFVPCTAREFHTTKKRLIHKYIHALFEPGGDKLNEAALVMLMTGIKPDKINDKTIHTVIGKIKERLAEKVRRKSYVSASRR